MMGKYAICIDNKDYPFSLEAKKIYKCVPDVVAEKNELIRIIDETEADYLYPKSIFTPLALSLEQEKILHLVPDYL